MRLATLALSAILCTAAAAHDSAEIDRLKWELGSLRERVTALEAQLNGGKVGAASKVQTGTKSAWRQLETGMTEEQVINLLGEPKRIVNTGNVADWQYDDGAYAVVVRGLLKNWAEPR